MNGIIFHWLAVRATYCDQASVYRVFATSALLIGCFVKDLSAGGGDASFLMH